MTLQLILYNQLWVQCCLPWAERFLFLLSEKTLKSPYGPLQFNQFSKEIEHKASQWFIKHLNEQGKQADRKAVTNYTQWLLEYCQEYSVDTVMIMQSSEPSLQRTLQTMQHTLNEHGISIQRHENTQFLLSHSRFLKRFPKPPIMETFYRWMRKEFDVLMDGNAPVWWQRNFDKENRKFDKHYQMQQTEQWVSYPTSRPEAIALLQQFVDKKIDRFGELEDAMYTHDEYVHHSLLSTSINFWLLTPWEVIDAISQTDTAINNKEWAIRQILWRREYMYHWFMFYHETIYHDNALNHTTPLPDWFWWPDDSPLQMYCVNHVLKTVKRTWYSHHITRLMIIWNFSLLMWYNPHDVNKRFWEMYADAFERVVTPNVLGMSQFVDWWNLATKPYISSANYINKMSDYCKHCYYDPKQKEWERACPMNYLYRNFVEKHRSFFARQPYIVSNLKKIDITKVKQQAQTFINQITTVSKQL